MLKNLGKKFYVNTYLKPVGTTKEQHAIGIKATMVGSP